MGTGQGGHRRLIEWRVGNMPEGTPRTEEERRARHQELYGAGSEPPAQRQGMGPPTPSPDDWAPELVVQFPLPPVIVPKFVARQMFGTGRRLPGETTHIGTVYVKT